MRRMVTRLRLGIVLRQDLQYEVQKHYRLTKRRG